MGSSKTTPVFLEIDDPNVALVSFRAELERALRELAASRGLPSHLSAQALLDDLTRHGVFKGEAAAGFGEFLKLGNSVAHGKARVDPETRTWLARDGARIIDALETLSRSTDDQLDVSDVEPASAHGLENFPIEELALGVFAYNTLKRAGIDTIGDLVARSRDELASLPSGSRSIREIEEALASQGLELAPPGRSVPQDASS